MDIGANERTAEWQAASVRYNFCFRDVHERDHRVNALVAAVLMLSLIHI